jgi:hypothetical protein
VAGSSVGDGAFTASPFLVMVKIKPNASGSGGEEVLEVIKPNVIRMADDPATVQDDSREMPFELVLPATATQEDIYERGGRPILDRVLAGYNASILAYGSTGSGKSHIMFGPGGHDEEALGMVPRLAGELFARLADYRTEHDWDGIVEATYVQARLQLYNSCGD